MITLGRKEISRFVEARLYRSIEVRVVLVGEEILPDQERSGAQPHIVGHLDPLDRGRRGLPEPLGLPGVIKCGNRIDEQSGATWCLGREIGGTEDQSPRRPQVASPDRQLSCGFQMFRRCPPTPRAPTSIPPSSVRYR